MSKIQICGYEGNVYDRIVDENNTTAYCDTVYGEIVLDEFGGYDQRIYDELIERAEEGESSWCGYCNTYYCDCAVFDNI